MPRCVLALDQGTTSSRAIAFDRRGRASAAAGQEFAQHFPQPGWVEHDATDIWVHVQETLGEVGADLASRGREVVAIGITDQRETTIVWDRRTGIPVHRALVWQDRRTAARCDELADAGALAVVRATTGLVLDPYFSASKIEWLLRPAPDGARRARDRAARRAWRRRNTGRAAGRCGGGRAARAPRA